jgi:prepilin-type N-terminal cleavage/methylation domain-containing protein
MKEAGYSLVEVVMAAAIVAIGVAAGAVMVNTLVVQEEMNAGAVRAANLQEQATRLYRLGLTNPQDIYNILPEACSASPAPASGNFSLLFGAATTVTNTVSQDGGGAVDISYQTAPCTVVYASAPDAAGQVAYLSNTVTIIRPTLRIEP